MEREFLFGNSFEELKSGKIKDAIISIGSTLGHENELREILIRQPSVLEHLFINIDTNKKEHIERVLKALQLEDGNFCISPEKIILSGKIIGTECESFSKIERLELPYSDIKHIEEIKKNFPKLKQIILPETKRGIAQYEDIGENINNLFEYANYRSFVQIKSLKNVEEIKKAISENEKLKDKFVISSDGQTIINLERLDEENFEKENLSIDLEEFKKIDKEKLNKSGQAYSIVINNAKALSVQEARKLKELNIEISGIKVFSKNNEAEQNELYDLETYIDIRERLDKLVEGIDINLPESERFAEVYRRICKNIVYDTPAANPITSEEKEYEKEQTINCRNLKNGLLFGKCICAGYADILRNALSLVDIESEYITGGTKKKVLNKDSKEVDKLKEKFSFKQDEKTGDITFYSGHAWNKVKIDGEWFNMDATRDADRIRNGMSPKFVYKSDKWMEETDKKFNFSKEIACIRNFDSKEIDETFNSKHLWIGNRKIPNIYDFVGTVRLIAEEYRDLGRNIYKLGVSAKENIKDKILKNKKTKMLDAPKADINDAEELKSWDLKNWGMNRSEVSLKTESRNCAKQNDKNSDKQEDEQWQIKS